MINSRRKNEVFWRYARSRWTRFVVIPSLVTICALFFLSEKKEESLISIPVKLINVPVDLVALPDVSTLEVRVRGPAGGLDKLREANLLYTIDLSEATSGSLPVAVSEDAISLPPKLSVLSVHPESLTVRVELRLKKIVCVIADLCGDPPPGHVVSKVVVDPSTVEVSGPYAVLDNLTAIRTTPIQVGGLTRTAKKKVALALRPGLSIRPAGSGLVDVEVVVEEKKLLMDFHVPIEGRNTHYPFAITPSGINIRVEGPVRTMEELAQTSGEPRAYTDLKGLGPGIYIRKCVISLPLDAFLIDAKPEVFTIEINDFSSSPLGTGTK